VTGFIRAYAHAMDWIFDPANAETAQTVLMENDRGLTRTLAKRTYDLFVDPEAGLFRDLALDIEGIRVVLELRSKFATPQRKLGDPASYVDPDYYRKAFGPQR
jgi:hypothetical protein